MTHIDTLIEDALALRKRLHDCAEISFHEEETSRTLIQWLEARGLAVTRDVGGTGFVCGVSARSSGPSRLFRSDLDALGTTPGSPHEVNLGAVIARNDDGRAAEHVCGHDGHCAMLAGALAALAACPDDWTGTVLGVFQPAEEIGEGAQAMLEHEALVSQEVDEAYAVHNVPGMPLGHVGAAVGVAALASVGIVVRMKGEGTHASTPHKGNAAISALATYVRELLALPSHVVPFGNSVLITPTYLDAGTRQFGRVPPLGELGAVLRADSMDCLESVLQQARSRLEALAQAYGLTATLDRVEPFPTTVNDRDIVLQMQKTLEQAGFTVALHDQAQPWSEDFGYFLQRWPGALLLLGAGEDHASLHSPQYVFPDDLVAPGIDMWLALCGWTGARFRGNPG